MNFLKSIAGKIVAGMVALAVVAGGISWWQMDPDTRQMLVNGVERIGLWIGVVILLPWATFFLIGRIAKLESNLAGAVLVAVYAIAETTLLGWLFHWHIQTATAWTFLVCGGLVAGVYNLLVCDWIAEKLE
jgi:FtsH-binding integral membrane protein